MRTFCKPWVNQRVFLQKGRKANSLKSFYKPIGIPSDSYVEPFGNNLSNASGPSHQKGEPLQSKRQILVWPWPKARCRHSNDIDFNDLAIDVGDVGIDLTSCRDKDVLYLPC